MQLITAHGGTLHALAVYAEAGRAGPATFARSFATGLQAIDGLLPGGKFARGVVHEVLSEARHAAALSFAVLLARCASEEAAVVWCDPAGEIYPPALALAGVDLGRVYLLRPGGREEEVWAVAECLRCRGVGATVAEVSRLSRVEARRLQLAAERGGGVGILLRERGRASAQYAAATRWLVTPARGDEAVQRWRVELVHCHGGRVGGGAVLEVCRDTNHVRAFEAVADRPAAEEAARASA